MLRKTYLGEIDPLKLDDDGESYLTAFLQQHPKSTLFKKDKLYSFQLCRPGDNITLSYEFKFTHDILVRQRKESKVSKELRYEVLANRRPLGSGAFGSVLLSEGVLKNKRRHDDKLFKPHPRAVKKIDFDPSNPREDNIAAAKTEYKNSIKASQLHVKPLAVTLFESQRTKSKPCAYLVMRLMNGKNLRHYIENESFNLIQLTTSQRIQLSIDILRKVKEQAHDIGIIHRDLKPENIMVVIDPTENQNKTPITNISSRDSSDEDDLFSVAANVNPAPVQDPHDVNLIDYSFCKIIDDPESDPGPMGSMITMPPEQFIYPPNDMPAYPETSDNYAAGKTLAELWWAEPEANQVMENYNSNTDAYIGFFRYAQHDTNYDFTKFLVGDLSDDHAWAIKQMLMQLTKAKPNDRLSLADAIKTLETIQAERNNFKVERTMALR